MTTIELAALAVVALMPWIGAAPPTPQPSRAADAPCGYVTFLPTGAPRVVNGTAYERIKVTVNFQDGHRETEQFPYWWVYPKGEETDPWSATNLKRVDFAVPMQLPPPSMDVNTFSPLIRYVLQHTRPDGYTNLAECGQPRTQAALPPGQPAAVGVRALAIPDAPMWLFFTDDSAPDAPVKIVDATMYTLYSELGGGGYWVRQCVTFWNRSLKTVTGIRFSFTYLDAAGALKTIQPIDRFGTFAPGVVVEGIRRGHAAWQSAPEPLKNCRSFLWAGEPGPNRVAVTSVEFEDHSTWPPGSATVWPAPQ